MKNYEIMYDPFVFAVIAARMHFEKRFEGNLKFSVEELSHNEYSVVTDKFDSWKLRFHPTRPLIVLFEWSRFEDGVQGEFAYVILRSDAETIMLPTDYAFASMQNPHLRRADLQVGDVLYYVAPHINPASMLVAESVVTNKGPDGDPEIKLRDVVLRGSRMKAWSQLNLTPEVEDNFFPFRL
jgi:hypothetical protein